MNIRNKSSDFKKDLAFKIFLIFSTMMQGLNAVSQTADSVFYRTGEISIFGNKVSTDNFFSPTKVSILTESEINNKNGESLADVLQTAGSVYIKSYGNSSSLSTISMNGMGAEHTLVLLNGFRLNSTQNALADLSGISKHNIERIEIMNNGASSIYGSEAIAGVVNIITKSGMQNEFGLGIKGSIGSYKSGSFRINVNKLIGRLNLNMEISNERSSNNYKYYFNNGTSHILKERLNSEYIISDYLINAVYHNGTNSEISFYSDYKSADRNIPGQETGSEPSYSNQKDFNWNNVISYKHKLSGSVLINSKLNFQNNLSEYNISTFINSYYRNLYLSSSSQITFIKNNFELISGYDLSYSALKSNELEDNIKRIQPGLFIVSEIDVNSSLKLFPSLRYDYISDIKKSVVSGKFGLNYRPKKDLDLNIRSSAGNSFSSPTFNELYWKDLGSKSIIPETAVNFDAGLIYGFDFITRNILEITYTYINAKNKIVWTPNSGVNWTPSNLSSSRSQIISADCKLNKMFSADFSSGIDLLYSYTSSVKSAEDFENDPAAGKQIFYVPFSLFKLNLNAEYKNSGINFFYSFTGKRFTDQENINFLPPTDILEGNVYHKFNFGKINAQVRLEANNILNTDYQIISGYPMALRNFKISVSLDY